jgi:hypothetical protein
MKKIRDFFAVLNEEYNIPLPLSIFVIVFVMYWIWQVSRIFINYNL